MCNEKRHKASFLPLSLRLYLLSFQLLTDDEFGSMIHIEKDFKDIVHR